MGDKKQIGVVYLIQPAELVGTNRYKIGCSGENSLKRCSTGYKAGTRFVSITTCSAPFEVERVLKQAFNEAFHLIAGKEYFEGNEETMLAIFNRIVKAAKDAHKGSSSSSAVASVPSEMQVHDRIEYKYKCTTCGYGTNKKLYLEKHMNRKRPCVANENEINTHNVSLHTCNKCGYRVTSLSGLTRHTLKCDGYNPLICPTCKCKFKTSDSKNRHCKYIKCVPLNGSHSDTV
jgi:ribosomal protein L37E